MTFTTHIEKPRVLDDLDQISWDDEADLVIIGFGGAGAAAAIEGVQQGASVIALDRFEGGGATAYSGGVVYAGDTWCQREAGYEDSSENMYAYLSQESSPVADETLQRFCKNSSDDFEWLQSQGVPYNAKLFKEKTTYPPEGYYLYFSGNEKSPSYAKSATPAPRGHKPVGKGFTGYVHAKALHDSAIGKGVKVIRHAPVRRLILDKNGSVVGVEYVVIPMLEQRRHQAFYDTVKPMKPFSSAKFDKLISKCKDLENNCKERKCVRAKKGVVICAGGFVYNLDMLSKHKPLYGKKYKALLRLGSMGCDGSGIELGQSIGGAVGLMDSMFAGRSIAPPSSFIKGIIVDETGNRFINEDTYNGFLGRAIGDLSAEGKAWLILDKKLFFAGIKECLFPGKGMYIYTLPSLMNIIFGGTKSARTISGLAKKCGVNPENLENTIDLYNSNAADGSDSFGKLPDNTSRLKEDRYYAINMAFGNPFAMTMVFTLGGLKVDEVTGAVLNESGEPIPRLYAAGRSAIGLCSSNYISGMSISDTVFSGRRAARTAALN